MLVRGKQMRVLAWSRWMSYDFFTFIKYAKIKNSRSFAKSKTFRFQTDKMHVLTELYFAYGHSIIVLSGNISERNNLQRHTQRNKASE